MTHAERIKIVVTEVLKLNPDLKVAEALDTAELLISVARKGRLPGEPGPKKTARGVPVPSEAKIAKHRSVA